MLQVQPKMNKKLESDSPRIFESSRNGENVNLKIDINMVRLICIVLSLCRVQKQVMNHSEPIYKLLSLKGSEPLQRLFVT